MCLQSVTTSTEIEILAVRNPPHPDAPQYKPIIGVAGTSRFGTFPYTRSRMCASTARRSSTRFHFTT
jgi:hypothetical protein